MEPVTSYLLRYRFFLLSLILSVFMVFHTVNGQWIGDFWEHSAVVRELGTHPFSPKHPQLLLDAPHAFYSPYTLAVGCVSSVLRLSPVATLSLFSIFNLLLFLFSLRLFVLLLLDSEATAFYTLLFTLLLWGGAVWGYSDLFHLKACAYIRPYPSRFAISLALIGLSMYVLHARSGNRLWLIPVVVVNVVVMLTHPLTFNLMVVGVVSLSLGLRRLPSVDYGLLAGVFILSLLVAAAWPYFPFVKLVLSDSEVYHLSNRGIYSHVIKSIYPAFIGIPLLMLQIRSNWRAPLGFMFLGLCLIYTYGAVFEKWSYGHVMTHIVLVLHIAIADAVSRIESKLVFRQIPASVIRFAYCCLILIITVAFSFKLIIQPAILKPEIRSELRPAVTFALPGCPNTYDQYLFLSQYTRQYDVVLSDKNTSWVVPSFGGKVVAALHPLAFVPDHDIRMKDLERFFRETTPHRDRLEIIRKYQAKFLLLNKALVPMWETMMHAFQPSGRVVFHNDQFVLISLDALNESPRYSE